MSVAKAIKLKLTEALSPESMELVDQSYLHAGHAGHDGSGESHFRLAIVSTAFEGKSRVERQRMVNQILKEELAGPVHALTMELDTP